MTGKPSVCLALALICVAAPAFGGTVYVPILSENGSDDTTYLTRVWLTNHGNGPQSVETLLLADNTNGTNRDGKKSSKTSIPAGGTVVLEVESGPGLLEIIASGAKAGDLAISAEVRNPDQKGAQETHSVVPIISSENARAGGDILALQGLRRTGGVFTNLVVVNLGHSAAQCSVKVFRAGGDQIASTALLSLKALTQVQFPDALNSLGEKSARDVNSQVECDQPFFAYLTLYEQGSGEVLVLEPSASGDSSLAAPGEEEPPSVPGAILFTQKGTFHIPTPGNPTAIYNIPVPKDRTFSNVTVDLDVFIAGWYNKDPSGLHSLFWLHRGACCWPKWARNITGFANVFGPNRNVVKVISNMDMGQFDKSRGEKGVSLQPGQTYHVRFEYNTSTGTSYLQLTQGGSEVAFITMPTTVNRLQADGTEAWMIYFGHEFTTHGEERPSFGWRYENLRVEFLP